MAGFSDLLVLVTDPRQDQVDCADKGENEAHDDNEADMRDRSQVAVTCMYVCMYVCVYACMYVSPEGDTRDQKGMYICMLVFIFIYTYIYIYIYIYTHTHTHTHTYIYIHTYTHTHI